MTKLRPKTCQRCHKPTMTPVTILMNPASRQVTRRLAQICPLCYVQLLALLNENLEVIDARKALETS